MIVRLHKQARTTPAIRAEIQAASGTHVELAQRFNVSVATIIKWRNAEKPRERMVEDWEFRLVYGYAENSMRRLMDLVYRTCQRPDDLIKAGPANVRTIDLDGRETRVLRVRQGKTGKTVDIVLAGDLERVVDEHMAAPSVWPTFVHTRADKQYTYSGLVAMFRRYVAKAGLTDFGIYDLKGKGATDMYRAGTPVERIQQLLGHESVTTTEIYLKARLPDVAMPNMREMRTETPENIPQAGNMPLKEAQGLVRKTAQGLDSIGGASQIRTVDLRIKSPLLYQLS